MLQCIDFGDQFRKFVFERENMGLDLRQQLYFETKGEKIGREMLAPYLLFMLLHVVIKTYLTLMSSDMQDFIEVSRDIIRARHSEVSEAVRKQEAILSALLK